MSTSYAWSELLILPVQDSSCWLGWKRSSLPCGIHPVQSKQLWVVYLHCHIFLAKMKEKVIMHMCPEGLSRSQWEYHKLHKIAAHCNKIHKRYTFSTKVVKL